MKKYAPILIAFIAWFAVIAQFVLMMQNLVAPVGESIIRFFSFFTILTNTLVAVYFTREAFQVSGNSILDKPAFLTAMTVYITVVGLVYQIALRHVWDPQGLQKVVDELLHSVVPVLVIVYWYGKVKSTQLGWSVLPYYLLYPLIYLVYVLTRGSFSGFYPYYFINVDEMGWQTVGINSLVLLLVFLGLSAIFIAIGKRVSNAEEKA
ncbi:MAG: Pr6Pr family membrane protein [Saprospiraceae bacterium]|nr:Pr6Pr family membrane protein [Saprospiraceae bacterium]